MTIAEQLRSEGYKKGEHEKAIEIARNMLINQFDYEAIKKITGLSSLDLSKLVNNH